jgi:uncharacterized protein DUF6252
MKIRLIYFALLIASLSLFSCHKEVSVETKSGLSGDFRALIDGVDWIAADSTKGAAILGGMINITGVSADNKQISITLNDTVTGVYTLNQTTTSFAAYVDNASSVFNAFATNQGTDTTQAGGTVTITQIDKANKTISGTFSFAVYRNSDSTRKMITAGVFYKLSYTDSLTATNGSDTMNVAINGANWTAQNIIASALAGQLIINGSSVNGAQAVSLIMPLSVAPGSYTLDYTTTQTYIGAYTQTPSISLVSAGGTLTILENNTSTHRIKGNFQFQAVDPLGVNSSQTLTNGYFSIQYAY